MRPRPRALGAVAFLAASVADLSRATLLRGFAPLVPVSSPGVPLLAVLEEPVLRVVLARFGAERSNYMRAFLAHLCARNGIEDDLAGAALRWYVPMRDLLVSVTADAAALGRAVVRPGGIPISWFAPGACTAGRTTSAGAAATLAPPPAAASFDPFIGNDGFIEGVLSALACRLPGGALPAALFDVLSAA